MNKIRFLTKRSYSHCIAEESIWIFPHVESGTNPWNPIRYERRLVLRSSAREEEEEEQS
jgi:hypothetical protein